MISPKWCKWAESTLGLNTSQIFQTKWIVWHLDVSASMYLLLMLQSSFLQLISLFLLNSFHCVSVWLLFLQSFNCMWWQLRWVSKKKKTATYCLQYTLVILFNYASLTDHYVGFVNIHIDNVSFIQLFFLFFSKYMIICNHRGPTAYKHMHTLWWWWW